MAAAKCPRNDPLPAQTLIRRSAAISSIHISPPYNYLTASGWAILLGALIILCLATFQKFDACHQLGHNRWWRGVARLREVSNQGTCKGLGGRINIQAYGD